MASTMAADYEPKCFRIEFNWFFFLVGSPLLFRNLHSVKAIRRDVLARRAEKKLNNPQLFSSVNEVFASNFPSLEQKELVLRLGRNFHKAVAELVLSKNLFNEKKDSTSLIIFLPSSHEACSKLSSRLTLLWRRRSGWVIRFTKYLPPLLQVAS